MKNNKPRQITITKKPLFTLLLACLVSFSAWSQIITSILPSKVQLKWADSEIGVLIDFDLLVFEPSYDFRKDFDYHPDPSIFNPEELNTDQWILAAKNAGASYAVLVAKHCSGFSLWPTRAHPYSVKNTPWRGGKGDIVRDFIASCRKYGLKPGIYASTTANGYLKVDNPGKVVSGDPAEQKKYNEIVQMQLTELWSEYGDLFEVWFDGGILPPEKGGFDVLGMLKRYQPETIAFQGPYGYENNIRWVGNEEGVAPYPCWARADSTTSSSGVIEIKGLNGNPDGLFWCPGESDFPLRYNSSFQGGWFWHKDQDDQLRSLDELMDKYVKSVGRNTNMLLGLVVDNRGLVPDADVRRLNEFGQMIRKTFSEPLGKTAGKGRDFTVRFKSPKPVVYVVIMEDISGGERIREYQLSGMADGIWQPLCSGTCIGHKKIEKIKDGPYTAIRLEVTKSDGIPQIRSLACYGGSTEINTGGKVDSTKDKDPVKVFILAGQSNAVGYNHIKEYPGVDQDLRKILNHESPVLFWPGSNARPGFAGTWTKLQPGVSEISVSEPYRDGCFGPEISFAMGIEKALPGNKIAILKYAEGGTGIARSIDYQDYIPALKNFDDKGRNWYPPVEGKPAGLLYRNLMDNIHEGLAALKKEGLNYEICGFIWMQGEHEAGISKRMAGDYGLLLGQFRESVRNDLNIKDLPFIVGEINSHTWAFADIARKTQAEACQEDPSSLLIKTTDLSRGSIGGAAHFDATGMMILGDRFVRGMLGLLEDRKNATTGGSITFESLLSEMTDRSAIARWPDPEFRLLQASSYDRRSVEKDQEGWYANEDWSNYIRKEVINGREEYVLMDADGPGAITRFWTGGHPNQTNHLRFYIDGQDTPFWEAGHTGALIGQNQSIGRPLSERTVDQDSLNINQGAQPGHNLFAPIPFEKHIKITSDRPKGDAGTGFWYNINYRVYDRKVGVESFSAETPQRYSEILKKTNEQLNDFMKLSPVDARAAGEKKVTGSSAALVPNDSLTIVLDEPGSIRRISLSMNAEDLDDAIRHTRILIKFDGRFTVDVPAGFFFGCGDQLVEARDWYRKVDRDGNMACYWVMPYRKNAIVQIVNQGNKPISGTIEVATGDWQWDSRSMHFHAEFSRLGEMPAKTTRDFNFIDLKNQVGVYAGDILQAYKTFRGWWGEGDEKIYIDGSTFPDHFGTGSEDYYGYAWGHPETYNSIFNGQPIGNANTGTIGGTTVNSRVRSLDGIPFKKSFRFDMESWQLYGGPVNYALACFWYGK